MAQKIQHHPPDTSPSHQEVYTSPWIKLIHQGADTRSKRNYDPAACEKETTDRKILGEEMQSPAYLIQWPERGPVFRNHP